METRTADRPNGGIPLKKITALLLMTALIVCTLASCSSGSPAPDAPEETGDFQPEITSQPDASALPQAVDLPLTDDPAAIQPTPEPAQTTHSYTLTALTDTSFGFVFAYPTGWKNLPGKHTICFREDADSASFPARVAITKKTFAHTPKSSKVLDQFKAYAQTVLAQYNSDSIELGDLNSNARFLGQTAHEITYLAYSGDIEVKGYMICCSVDHDIYVFHFCCAYDDYAAMESMISQMRDTVTIVK